MEKAIYKSLILLLLLFASTTYSQNREAITGQLLYHGIYPWGNVQVFLHDASGTTVASTSTNPAGHYTFPNVESGDYTITFFKEGPSTGVNLSDAMLVMLHLLNVYPFTPIQTLASDVNASGSVTWSDYYLIVSGYLNQGNPFPAGAFVFEPVSLSTGNRTGVSSGGSSSGDASGTFIPTKNCEVLLIPDAIELKVNPMEDFDLEINGKAQTRVSGMHLALSVPEGLEISSLKTDLDEVSFTFSEESRILRLTWLDRSLAGLALTETDNLFTLVARLTRVDRSDKDLALQLLPESHFIDLQGSIIPGVELKLPAISVRPARESQLSLYPNPCVDRAVFSFSAPGFGDVDLSIADQNGKVVEHIQLTSLTSGNQEITIDATRLAQGMYHYRLVFRGESSRIYTGSFIKSK
jgi:hypothetical protein